MNATAKNSKAVLLVCIAYTSTDEILHSVEESSEEKWDEIKVLKDKKHEKDIINVLDIERHMYMAVAPDPDIIIRTSGETRLSNFLLWQSTNCLLYSPSILWPEIGFRHLVWAILDFQHKLYRAILKNGHFGSGLLAKTCSELNESGSKRIIMTLYRDREDSAANF
ncbi:hypothetical protein E3N88_37508 [Mikania micrantha]|uniref:Alkyl transferase n=1 Tax=Mikania micrantha TaxID=192012 RepID=A0A5N6LRE9_9ASTR|nr:hypothetical protein E3N88_37508 [Mikania micrantha]